MKKLNVLPSPILSTTLLLALLMQPVGTALAAEGGHHLSNHSIGLFLGATNAPVENITTHAVKDETEATFGLEYEYRMIEAFGLGVLYEASPDAHHELGEDVTLLLANWHPNNSWRLSLGFGKVKGDEGDDGHGNVIHEVDESVTRLGVAYDIHFSDGWGLAPTLNLDFIDGETVEVFGVVLVKGF